MKKVVSFCLWGTNPYYLEGAVQALFTAREFYPDWEHWFYLADDVPSETAERLAAGGAELIRRRRGGQHGAEPNQLLYQPTFWRFLPASDPEVEFLLVRDTDSPVTPREVAAVHEWLASGKDFHIMRDHPKHEYPVLAGMWGCRTSCLRDMNDLVARWSRFDYYGCDQKFLGTVVYPRVRSNAWIHSECIFFPHEIIHPFPSSRANSEFVGISFTGDERVRREIGYLERWIADGSPKELRPHPWGLKGRLRHYWRIIRARLGFS